jgi:hypothetical protein
LGGAQIHDLNPGIRRDGLFWTTVIHPEDVSVNLDAGTATFEVEDFHTEDYGSFENAIGEESPPVPVIVSFKVQWSVSGNVLHFDNLAQMYRGDFQYGNAQIEYRFRTPHVDVVSAPLADSTTVAAQLGSESNGSFY